MLLALACTRTPGPGELQPPGLPKLATAVTGAAAQPGQLDVAGPFRPVWRTDDVCATAWQRPGLSELCEPWLPSPTCVGERCPRWDARNALECLIAAGTDVETFAGPFPISLRTIAILSLSCPIARRSSSVSNGKPHMK